MQKFDGFNQLSPCKLLGKQNIWNFCF